MVNLRGQFAIVLLIVREGGVDAFVFTERGVYRPGDEIHIGVIVKQRNWGGQLKGLPVENAML